MEYLIALLGVLTGGGVLALLQWWNTKNNEKKKGEIENKAGEIANDKNQIDLVNEYRDSTFETVQQVLELTKKQLGFSEQNSIQQTHMLEDIRYLKEMTVKNEKHTENLEDKVNDVTENLSDVVMYLNGDFARWKEKNGLIRDGK